MSVTSANLARSGLSAMRAGTSPQGADIESEYEQVWIVKCSSANDGPVAIFEHFAATQNLPYFGRIYEYGGKRDSSAICLRLRPQFQEKSNDPWVWHITVEYGPRTKTSGKKPQPPGDNNPFDEPDDYSMDRQWISVPTWKAKYISGLKGTPAARRKPNTLGPVVNSALQPYDPTLETEIPIKIVNITRSVGKYDDWDWVQYEGRVNTDFVDFSRPVYAFYAGAGQYKARFVSPTPQLNFTPAGRPYWRVTWEFHIHPISWREEVLDRGMHALVEHGEADGLGGVYSPGDLKNGVPPTRALLDANGMPIREPVNLNGAGQPLEAGKEPVYLTYAKYEEIDFGPLLAKIFGA